MRHILSTVLWFVLVPTIALADDVASEIAAKRFQTFLDIKAIQPRLSGYLDISSVNDWLMFYPADFCQFHIDGSASKAGELRFIVTCPRFAYARSALTFRFETRSDTPATLYLQSLLSDTVDVSDFEYEQFLEKPFSYYGSFQSAMTRNVSLAFLVNDKFDRHGTLMALLGVLRDDGGYKCVVLLCRPPRCRSIANSGIRIRSLSPWTSSILMTWCC